MTQRLALYLLGKPRIERDGEPARALKGKKAWGLLAFLLRSDSSPTRERLASLLFGDADDPLGALRWNLAELRRSLGDPQSFRGEPVSVSLPPDCFIDVRAVTNGTWVDAAEVPGLGRDLLEGMNFGTSPSFEAWLLTERRHLAAASANVLREAVLSRLAKSETDAAISLATRLVELDPLDEASQSLLVRSLSSSGDPGRAREQVEACRQLFRRELGIEPGPEVTGAVNMQPLTPAGASVVGGSATARAQLDAGQAAITAGAVEAGIDCLRRATLEARGVREPRLQAECLLALGAALIHSVRARDDDGATALHEAISIATEIGMLQLAATAHRELGYVELLRARYERAERWASKALELADTELGERAMSRAILGICLADTGRHEEALDMLTESVVDADEGDAGAAAAFATSFIARSHVMRNELDAATQVAQRSLELARDQAWTSFVPWPEAILAEVEMLRGESDSARTMFEHAFALGCQLGDPCWEGIAARGLGLLAAAQGDHASALSRLDDARTRCVRLPDAYLWVQAYSLDALCRVAVTNRSPDARRWIDDLGSLSGRTGMREFVARSYLYRSQLGDQDALETATVMAEEVQNPALAKEIAAAAS